MSHWSVDAALILTINTIEQGAVVLNLSKDARQKLDIFYRESYQTSHDNGKEWEEVKERILVLARAVGAIAASRESFASFPRLPREVSSESAVTAAETVAHLKICPDDIKLGSFCNFKVALENQSAEIQALVAAWRPLLERNRKSERASEYRP